MTDFNHISEYLKHHHLKVTPQRVAVFRAIVDLRNHPSAENIIAYIRNNHPNIAVGTVYNTLETLVNAGLVTKIQTERGVMRYDAEVVKHYHLFCSGTGEIRDYFDEELRLLLVDHFRNKTIPGFMVEDIKVYVKGEFTDNQSNNC